MKNTVHGISRIPAACVPGILVFALSLGTAANDIVAYPVENSSPSPLAGPRIIINIPERVLRIYRVDGAIDDFTAPEMEMPIAIGQRAWPTPEMESVLEEKTTRPAWHAPRVSWAGEHAGRIVPFDSGANPFRARNSRGKVEGYFLSIGTKGIGLHSTAEQRSIGRLASHGCIRMRLDDVRLLYRTIPIGTPVSIVYQLNRLVPDGASIRLRSFADVYRKYNAGERAAHLAEHLQRHSLDPAILAAGIFDEAAGGKNVTLDFRSGELSGSPTVKEAVASDARNRGVTEANLQNVCRQLARKVDEVQ